jgi:hypothetical protein
VYIPSFWDDIRKEQKKNNEKKQKRSAFLMESIKTYSEILNDENRIPKTPYTMKHLTGCDTWRQDYQRTFDAYTNELKQLTAQ